MKYKIFEENSELNSFVVSRIVQTITQKPQALLCLPSGESPQGIFEELVRLELSGGIDFSNAYFAGLDEWMGLGVNHPDSCLNFMDKYFFSQLNIDASHIYFFDGETNDPQKECNRIDQFIASRNGIDFMLLGVGMNGHLGLNEPGTDASLYSHVVTVDETTKEVARNKYFDLPVDLDKGITLGLRHIAECREAIVIINGSHKSDIAVKILKGEITPQVPATLVRENNNILFCLDRQAAAKL
ncbi:MAG TPA: glucosamine-6-phosphate deaminase [Cyclobacteriaceae bacterium]|nr:glucosamine-6-phosphate deaminase [Cyclobacteriaceae bacterium]